MNETQIGYLQSLCNKYGDFKVAYAYKNSDGDIIWSKHRSVLECWHSDEGLDFLSKSNNRTSLPNEAIIDIDDEDESKRRIKFEDICDMLKEYGFRFYGYFSGSKGHHIHIIGNTILTKQDRETLISGFAKSDSAKISANSMITIENAPNNKTSKIKTLLRQNA